MSRTTPLWTDDEFEDYVARAMIALYETKIAKAARKAPRSVRLTEKNIEAVRKQGIFVPAPDRITWAERFDSDLDGLPDRAMFTSFCPKKQKDHIDSYLDLVYARRVKMKEVPGEFSLDKGVPYEVTRLWYMDREMEGIRWYCVLKADGTTEGGTRTLAGDYCYRSHVSIADQSHGVWLAAALNYYTDRKNTWLVKATDGTAKATFGVYPEQVKSLFYARSLPMTESGRKRPILHWVRAHKRRLELGTEIDIDKHLRGCEEFTWKGTRFSITNPTKAAHLQ